MRYRQGSAFGGAVLAALVYGIVPAPAADKVSAGKAADVAWTFTVLDVGMAEGIFQKYGIDVDISSYAGDAKLQQALASNSLDFGLGSGPSMAFTVKGAPTIAVAAFAAEPRNISITVNADSPIKTVADLKGKLLGVTTAGSLTEWLAKQMAIQEGWGENGVRIAALGSFQASLPALETHQIDGIVVAVESGYQLEEKHVGRIIVGMERYAPHFITHVVFARKDLVRDKPDLVRRFLQGFFATIHFMKTNKDATIAIGEKVLNLSPAVMNHTYDYEISMFEDDGHFDPQAVETIKNSFVGMGTLSERPSDDQLFTTQFVPVKP
jgi:NitT/TauT family transport system substrate-binding protein